MEIGSLLFLSLMDVILGVKSCEEKYKDDQDKEKRKKCIQKRKAYLKKLEDNENDELKKILDEYYEKYNKLIQDSLDEFNTQIMKIELQTADIEIIEEYFKDMRDLNISDEIDFSR